VTSEPTSATDDAIEREVRAFALRCPVPLPPGDTVLLGHGGGGTLTQALIRDLFVPALGGDPELSRMGDAAVVELPNGAGRLAFTTDGFVCSRRSSRGRTSGSRGGQTVNDRDDGLRAAALCG
jgi:hydrogenase expression/formation protein HypE